jgi:hypothetical protein
MKYSLLGIYTGYDGNEPLCAAHLIGWARSQLGKVFVEKREWTKVKWD